MPPRGWICLKAPQSDLLQPLPGGSLAAETCDQEATVRGFELPVPRWRWLWFRPSRRSPGCPRSDALALRVPCLPIMSLPSALISAGCGCPPRRVRGSVSTLSTGESGTAGGTKVRIPFPQRRGIFMLGVRVRSPIRGRRRVHQPRTHAALPGMSEAPSAQSNCRSPALPSELPGHSGCPEPEAASAATPLCRNSSLISRAVSSRSA